MTAHCTRYLARDIHTGLGIFAAGLPVMVTAGDPPRADLGAIHAYLPPSWLTDRWKREMRCQVCKAAALPNSRGLCQRCMRVYVSRELAS